MSTETPDINRLVEHYGSTAKLRVSYMTSCVFHDDRTPSLSINTDKNVWNCQSCGRGGNAIGLIMQKEECDYRAATELASTLGITAGGAGGSDGVIRSRHLGTRRQAPGGKRDRPGDSGYVPRWRRSS